MSDKKPLVSIVTPSYNQGEFIEDTLLSVMNQDYPNIEHIVVDGGSTDNTIEILKKYEKKYNLIWISEPDNGQSDAINKGFRMAKGEIVGWLNSDDVYFDKHVISDVVKIFCDRRVDVITGNSLIIDRDNLILRIGMHPSNVDLNSLLRYNYISQPATFIRNVFANISLNDDLHYAMDYDLWLKLVKQGLVFVHVDKIFACNRRHSTAKTVHQRRELITELKKVRMNYGCHFGMMYSIMKFMDKCKLSFLQIKGIPILVDIYLNRQNYNFAFKPKFDSMPKAILRQLVGIGYPWVIGDDAVAKLLVRFIEIYDRFRPLR